MAFVKSLETVTHLKLIFFLIVKAFPTSLDLFSVVIIHKMCIKGLYLSGLIEYNMTLQVGILCKKRNTMHEKPGKRTKIVTACMFYTELYPVLQL